MKDLPRIEAVWAKLDFALEKERIGYTGATIDKILAEQIVNDQAYFILCWGQLETEIDDKCREAVRRRRSIRIGSCVALRIFSIRKRIGFRASRSKIACVSCSTRKLTDGAHLR